jgi:hypothetical protein
MMNEQTEVRLKGIIKSAIAEALAEAGLAKDMVSQYQASKMISRRHVENGIASGKIRLLQSGGKKNYMVPVSDVLAYKNYLLNEGRIKIKKSES